MGGENFDEGLVVSLYMNFHEHKALKVNGKYFVGYMQQLCNLLCACSHLVPILTQTAEQSKLEIVVGHQPSSDQFQDLADQN